ncbi:NlpC/P60 family protein [Paenibacillus mesophilus]|uniref:C40 family peptidase n=1 Tax=Paenibacillus mesophilus TaxID=2582849 RepID=UPI00110D4A5C|nr:C40 family peptidase [Paenibacillus mesophilus]TMV50266.1 NlpC/P60 family protein [Paenibacillus mesophilus]
MTGAKALFITLILVMLLPACGRPVEEYAEAAIFGEIMPEMKGDGLIMAESEPEHKEAVCGFGAEPGNEYVVNAAVATLWSAPGRNRPMDEASLTPVVDMGKWTSDMTIPDKLWLVGKLETQALYGQRVKTIESAGDWVKVIVPGQSTSRNVEGYPGWMPGSQLIGSDAAYLAAACPMAVVKSRTAFLYHDPSGTMPFLELSFNTRLPILGDVGDFYAVQTPGDGEKYLLKAVAMSVRENEEAGRPTGEQLVETASLFLELPYLWAGVSGFGFDCSGFTHAIYGFHGLGIPRDASDQARSGKPVRRSDLQPGDLMFFAYNDGKGKVHHVGMYAGDGQMIHSPRTESSIEIISIDTPLFVKEYAGARRYLPD